MNKHFKHALFSATAIAVVLGGAAVAQTVTKKVETEVSPGMTSTTVTTVKDTATTQTTEVRHGAMDSPLPVHVHSFKFMDFDMNNDTILSRDEIGRMLFKFYDTDGNNVIDNVEYERPAVLTMVPIEKTTTVTYDFDGDGLADKAQTTYETFLEDTMLSRYDRNVNGLSPHEFVGREFLSADVNKDKAIDIEEWRGSYIASLDAKNKEKARLNK